MFGRITFTLILFGMFSLTLVYGQAVPPKANARPTPTPPVVTAEPFDKADVKTMAAKCVTLDTEAGTIEIEMFPESAPESVRKFP